MEGGEVDGCTGVVGVGGGGGWLAGAALCAVVDGWLRGDLRRVGGGGESMSENMSTPRTVFSGRWICVYGGGGDIIWRCRKFRRKVFFRKRLKREIFLCKTKEKACLPPDDNTALLQLDHVLFI